jgi:hypothetical protein
MGAIHGEGSGAEIHYFVTSLTQLCGWFLFQFKPAMIGSDSNAPGFPF